MYVRPYKPLNVQERIQDFFFLGGGALVSCSTSTPINHIVFFLQNTSSIRKPQVISGGVRTPCTLPLDPPLAGSEIHCFTWNKNYPGSIKKGLTADEIPSDIIMQ